MDTSMDIMKGDANTGSFKLSRESAMKSKHSYAMDITGNSCDLSRDEKKTRDSVKEKDSPTLRRSNIKTTSKKLMHLTVEKAEERRVKNNENERIRTHAQVDALNRLAQALPPEMMDKKKWSKQLILSSAISYIRFLDNLVVNRRLADIHGQGLWGDGGDGGDFLRQLQLVKQSMGNDWSIGHPRVDHMTSLPSSFSGGPRDTVFDQRRGDDEYLNDCSSIRHLERLRQTKQNEQLQEKQPHLREHRQEQGQIDKTESPIFISNTICDRKDNSNALDNKQNQTLENNLMANSSQQFPRGQQQSDNNVPRQTNSQMNQHNVHPKTIQNRLQPNQFQHQTPVSTNNHKNRQKQFHQHSILQRDPQQSLQHTFHHRLLKEHQHKLSHNEYLPEQQNRRRYDYQPHRQTPLQRHQKTLHHFPAPVSTPSDKHLAPLEICALYPSTDPHTPVRQSEKSTIKYSTGLRRRRSDGGATDEHQQPRKVLKGDNVSSCLEDSGYMSPSSRDHSIPGACHTSPTGDAQANRFFVKDTTATLAESPAIRSATGSHFASCAFNEHKHRSRIILSPSNVTKTNNKHSGLPKDSNFPVISLNPLFDSRSTTHPNEMPMNDCRFESKFGPSPSLTPRYSSTPLAYKHLSSGSRTHKLLGDCTPSITTSSCRMVSKDATCSVSQSGEYSGKPIDEMFAQIQGSTDHHSWHLSTQTFVNDSFSLQHDTKDSHGANSPVLDEGLPSFLDISLDEQAD